MHTTLHLRCARSSTHDALTTLAETFLSDELTARKFCGLDPTSTALRTDVFGSHDTRKQYKPHMNAPVSISNTQVVMLLIPCRTYFRWPELADFTLGREGSAIDSCRAEYIEDPLYLHVIVESSQTLRM